MGTSVIPTGHVLQVNVSPGGVPKLPVASARVGRFGLEGDRQREGTVHGGPHRAVALFAIEAIRRVAAEGHPIAPGSCGENLTTQGVELATLPIGTRLAIGDELVLEVSAPDNPCSTVEGSFSDRRFSRISIVANPTDSRMYARVLVEGEVRPGDPIRVLEPARDSRASELAMLARVDAARRRYWLANWGAAVAADLDVRVVDDGELAMAASPAFPGPGVNQALGLALLPNLVPRATSFFAEHGVEGWIQLEPGDVPAEVAEEERYPVSILAVEPGRIQAADVPGLAVRAIKPDESPRWVELLQSADPDDGPNGARLRAMAPHMIGSPEQSHRRLYVAELEGRAVGVAALYDHRRVGWLAAVAVVPEARGRGVGRALIGARARDAAELGCDLVALDTEPASASAANAIRVGLVEIGRWTMFRLPAAADTIRD